MSAANNTPAGTVPTVPAGGVPAPTGHAGADRLIARARAAGLAVSHDGGASVGVWTIASARPYGGALFLYVSAGGRRLSIVEWNALSQRRRHGRTKQHAAMWIEGNRA